ncbi:MAG: caspase family protein [Granulosicoccus sp.]
MRRPRTSITRTVSIVISFCLLSACASGKQVERTAKWIHPEDLYIVDCLLPSQVRQLGRQLTYLAPRRPIRTTAARCSLRGGEYTAYSRSDLTSALSVWRPMAELGDPQAQTYVGEIYEKGLGTTASYQQAAYWYQKASDQNYSRAKINLGFLYESGLGVEKNLVKALNLYREASGFNPQHLEFISSVDYQNKESLKQRNQVLQHDTRQLEQDLATSYKRLQEQAAVIQSNQQSIAELEKKLVKQKAPLPQMATSSTAKQAQGKPESESQSDSHNVAMPDRKRLVGQEAEKTQPDDRQTAARETLEETKGAAALEQSLQGSLKASLDERQTVLARQKDDLLVLRTRLLAIETQLESMNSDGGNQSETNAALAIDIIDPPLMVENSLPTIVTSPAGTVDLVGKVNPVESVYSLRINGKDHDFDRHGLFHYVSRGKPGTRLDLSAVDQTGHVTRISLPVTATKKETDSKTLLKTSHKIRASTAKFANSVDAGNYHALLITNDNSRQHPGRPMATEYGNELGTVLSEKFGFQTTQVTSGSNVDILGAFDALRSSLTDDDNLLVYFTGHSRTDKTGTCYWLPSDAADNSSTTGLSTRAIVRLIDTLLAKHVLILADACFDETITRTSIARPLPEQTAAQRKRWLDAISRSKARTVLASGSTLAAGKDAPGKNNSIFTDAVLAALQQSEGVTEAYQLFLDIQQTISLSPDKDAVSNLPYYSPIKHAGHEAGEFIFVPVKS